MIESISASPELLKIPGFLLFTCALAFAWAPILTHLLYRFKVSKGVKVELAVIEGQRDKANTPVMGGLLVIITVSVVTFFFNWTPSFTYFPIGIMLFSAALGAVDDLLNIYGSKRRIRSIRHTLILIKVHQSHLTRLWLILTLPWAVFKRIALFFGSHTGKGVYVHEKLLLQFIAGAMAAWWIYFKLGEAWHFLDIPFVGNVEMDWIIFPFIVLVVMFTANAVNIADGMDGLAGGMLITTFGALTFISGFTGFQELALLNATLVGALIAYTYFNIKPARFMMGDVGSLGLGAILAVNALAIGENVTLLLLGFMFYVEAFTVIIQVLGRYILKRKIFKMAPIHHHFELSGWSEEKTIMRFWLIHLIFVILGVWITLQ